MPLYPFCSHCVATRVCTYVETPVPPWSVDEAGFTDISPDEWVVFDGTIKTTLPDGWVRFTGGETRTMMGMVVSDVSFAEITPIEFRFTARSDWARDIVKLNGWLFTKAVPDLTFYPEARRYHVRFASFSTALQIGSTKALGATENFELASDMQYRVVV